MDRECADMLNKHSAVKYRIETINEDLISFSYDLLDDSVFPFSEATKERPAALVERLRELEPELVS